MRIIFADVAGPMVAQIMIDSRLSIGIVSVSMPIHNVEAFTGMDVIEVQTVFGLVRQHRVGLGDCPRTRYAEKEDQGKVLEVLQT